ncbi:nucleotide-diphospho-sugar transferase [Hyphopichia burtonii NRRL Y-1933]|uniref:Nucleotide-diphospho-sugar transferase n=1 Tax=Hyphopichia burtonii NRRL Y-1933 TaxID=984485 RepID=A0A1E4RMH8_9ASCO|nr:nucleotide-diphospho-sugar transferase [Hyphopichia burtonii NRRL Y-1933]ODV68463.1 nucleotide-diphospho-sugar transferase [Hyphopichia burtonii NRRL Y-1933]
MNPIRQITRQKAKVIGSVFILIVIYHIFSRSSSTPRYADNGPVLVGEEQVVNGKAPLQDPPGAEVIPPQKPNNDGAHVDKEEEERIKSIRDYTAFFNGLEDYTPKSESIKGKYKGEKAKEMFSTTKDFLFTKEYLENVLDISQETFDDLQNSHTRYVDNHINKLIENVGVQTFGNVLQSDPEWSAYQGSKGYVLVGGGQYSWLSYLVIRQIRATGSLLPIELFIATQDDYEKKFCEELLPLYNARCNVFDTNLAKDLKARFNLGGYQYKMLAILSSKFESVLYVDSDNFPTKNVDYLFNSKLYQDNGLIIWPDAWARTTNPKFFDIALVKVKENKVRYSPIDYKLAEDGKVKPLGEYKFSDSNYHDFEGTIPNPTSETGMLMINKTSHLKTLLLALYYNVFGPNHYYPLLTQGSAGEGDKETFIAAATVMKQTWFQTLKQFKWTGYFHEKTRDFSSKALGHYDPIQSQDEKLGDNTDIIFMHLSYPKFYPNWLVDNHDLVYEESGNHIRMYEGIYGNVGYDFDLRTLQLFVQGLCPNYYYETSGLPIDGEPGLSKSIEYMGKYLKYVANDEGTEIERCKNVFIPHLKWLKETTKHPDTLSFT